MPRMTWLVLRIMQMIFVTCCVLYALVVENLWMYAACIGAMILDVWVLETSRRFPTRRR